MAMTARSAARETAISPGHFLGNGGQQAVKHHVCDGGQGVAGLARVCQQPQGLDSNLELVVVGEAARDIQDVFVVAGVGQAQVKLLPQLGVVGQGAKEAWCQHGVQKAGIPCQHLGKARRVAHDFRQ